MFAGVVPVLQRPRTEGTIFEKLTDTRRYTGSHKHRNDQAMHAIAAAAAAIATAESSHELGRLDRDL